VTHTDISKTYNQSTEGDLLHEGRITVTANVINFMLNNTELQQQWTGLLCPLIKTVTTAVVTIKKYC